MPYSKVQFEAEKEKIEKALQSIKEAKDYSAKVACCINIFTKEVNSCMKSVRRIEAELRVSRETLSENIKTTRILNRHFNDVDFNDKICKSACEDALVTFDDKSVPENHKFALHVDKFHKISNNKLKMNKLGRKMRKFKQMLENNSKKSSKNAETKVTASLVSMKPNEELGLKKLNLY